MAESKKNIAEKSNEQSIVNGTQETNLPKTIASRLVAGVNWCLANNKQNDINTGNATKECSDTEVQTSVTINGDEASAKKKKKRRKRNTWGNRHVAMDCEMVGGGQRGEIDILARVSIVNRHGMVLLDKYVKPSSEVVDYRTCVSGIRPTDIENGENFSTVQRQVQELLQGKVLVGHGLRKDLAVLKITHPFHNIRDTSCYKPLARLVANGHTPSLKRLVYCILGDQIQTGEHDSVEDAKAAMSIYNSCSEDWEKFLQRKMR